MKNTCDLKPRIIVNWNCSILAIFLSVKDCLISFNQEAQAFDMMNRFLNPKENVYGYSESIDLMEEYVVILNRSQCPYEISRPN